MASSFYKPLADWAMAPLGHPIRYRTDGRWKLALITGETPEANAWVERIRTHRNHCFAPGDMRQPYEIGEALLLDEDGFEVDTDPVDMAFRGMGWLVVATNTKGRPIGYTRASLRASCCSYQEHYDCTVKLSRVWVSPNCRRNGLALDMVTAVSHDVIGAMRRLGRVKSGPTLDIRMAVESNAVSEGGSHLTILLGAELEYQFQTRKLLGLNVTQFNVYEDA